MTTKIHKNFYKKLRHRWWLQRWHSNIKRAWNEQRKKVLRFGSFRVIKNWKSELIVIILRIQLRKIDIFSGFKINKIQIKKSLGKCKMKLFYCQNKWRISVSTYAILATTLKTLARCRLYATYLKFAMIFCVCHNKNTTLKTIIISNLTSDSNCFLACKLRKRNMGCWKAEVTLLT